MIVTVDETYHRKHRGTISAVNGDYLAPFEDSKNNEEGPRGVLSERKLVDSITSPSELATGIKVKLLEPS